MIRFSLPIFLIMIVLSNSQCQIPPNCDTYSTTLKACTSCQANYALVNNYCYSFLPSTSGIFPANSFQSSSPSTTTFTPSSTIYPTSTSINFFPSTTTTNTPIQTPSVITGVTPTPNTGSSIYQITTTSQTVPSSFIPASSLTQASTGSTNSGPTIENCRNFTSGICYGCYDWFYLDQNICQTVNPLCRTYNLQGDCTQCYDGFTLVSGKCFTNPSYQGSSSPSSTVGLMTSSGSSQGSSSNAQTDPYCKIPSGAACSECYKGYFYSQASQKCLLST